MIVDADVTVEIIRNLREEVRAGFAEMRAEFADVRTEMRAGFAELRDDLGVLQMRLGTVERVVVAFSRELAHLVGRVDKLEHQPT